MVKSVPIEFFDRYCKKCPLIEKVEEESSHSVTLECDGMTCPVMWQEGYKNLSPYKRKKLTKVFPKEILQKEWVSWREKC
jgi:hypothetical protein